MGSIGFILARSNRQYDILACDGALFLGSIGLIAAELNVLKVIGVVSIFVDVQVEGNGGTAILLGCDILFELEVLPLLGQGEVTEQIPMQIVTRTSVNLCFDIGGMICACIDSEFNLLASVEHVLVRNEELTLPVGELHAIADIHARVQIAFANNIHRSSARHITFFILVFAHVSSSHR